MKKNLKIFLAALVFLVTAAITFYFWAKSSVLSEVNYNQDIAYQVESPRKNDSIISVMTYNVGYLSGMTNNLAVRPSQDFYHQNETAILAKLKSTTPDLVGFQEIDYNSKRSYHTDQHTLIGQELYPYTVKSVNWDKRYVPFPYYPLKVHFGKVLSGQSMMSKYPLENSKRIVLEEVASQPFYYKALYLNRLLQVATVKHPLGAITFMNVHAEAFDQATRKAHIDFVYERFWEAAQKGPVILVGDFNSDPNYENSAILKFLADERIGHAASGTVSGTILPRTYPSNNPKERLDYIFFTLSDFELVDSKVVSTYETISDHLPCIAKLRIINR